MSPVLTWFDAAGTATPFDGSTGILVHGKPLGLEAPDPTNTIEDYISFDGAAVTNVRRGTRPIALPILLEHPTRVETTIAELARLVRAPGRIQIADGVHTRSLKNVIYSGGINGGGDISMPLSRSIVLALVALDPWWYGDPIVQPLAVAAATPFNAAIPFNAPIPFNGGSSVSFTVDGDADAYPVITVQGPATTVTVGTSGGVEWVTDVALGAADSLIVDTRPGQRGPRLNGGTVNWALLTPASRLWTLPAGSASVVSGVIGSTGATSVTLSYEPRYATR